MLIWSDEQKRIPAKLERWLSGLRKTRMPGCTEVGRRILGYFVLGLAFLLAICGAGNGNPNGARALNGGSK